MRAKAASFNPLGDYCLVVTESMDLFVICVERIVSGTEVMGKASSGLSWHREVVSQVYRAAPGPDSGDGVTSVLGAESFLCHYTTHCFSLCRCCTFLACDCRMNCPEACTCLHDEVSGIFNSE